MADQKPIKVKHGKGVLAKGGTPYAAGTIHATNRRGFKSPYLYTPTAVAVLLADDNIREIEIIDLDNVQSTITKTWIAEDVEGREAAWAAIRADIGNPPPPPARRRATAKKPGAKTRIKRKAA